MQSLDIEHPAFLISLLRRVVKLAVFPQLLIVFGQQGFDLYVGGNVLRHRLELPVLDIRNLGPQRSQLRFRLCDLCAEHMVFMILNAKENRDSQRTRNNE